jgi:phospholipase A-2-activating protein
MPFVLLFDLIACNCLGLVITGGQDAIVNVFDLGSDDPEPVYALLGHTENVCTLDTFGEGMIISGSWDK